MSYRFLNNFTEERDKEREYYNLAEFDDDDDEHQDDNKNSETDLEEFLKKEVKFLNDSKNIVNEDDKNVVIDKHDDDDNYDNDDINDDDYDVENYDIDTLFKFLNLDKESTDFQIKDSANNLSLVMKNKKKKNLSIFFESIKDKLLDWKKEERNKKNNGQTIPLPMGIWLEYDDKKNNIINNTNKELELSPSLLSRSSLQSPPPEQSTFQPSSMYKDNSKYKIKNKKSKKTKHLVRINTMELKEDEQMPNVFVYNLPNSLFSKNIKSYSVESIQISIKNTFDEDQYFDFNGKPYFIPKGYYTTETLCKKVSELTDGELSISFHDKKTRFTKGTTNAKGDSNANDANRIMIGLYANKPLFYSLGMRDIKNNNNNNNNNLDKNENEIIEYESLDYIINEDFHKLNTSNYFELYIDYLANPKINNSPVAIFQTYSTSCMTTTIDKNSFSSVKKQVDSEAKQLYIKVLDDNGNLLKLNERVGTIILKVAT
jgi:hypothetical protein